MTTGLISQGNRWGINRCSLFIVTMFSILSFAISRRMQGENLVQYDTLTHKKVYIYVEKMPQYKGGNSAFMIDFGKKFHYQFGKHEDIQTKLRFQFIIDKKGFLIGARIYNKKYEELTSFEKEGLRTITSLQNWESGKHNNKNVDVMLTMDININPQ